MSESVKCAKSGAIGSTSNELPGVAEPRLVCGHCWDALRAELEAWKADAERLANHLPLLKFASLEFRDEIDADLDVHHALVEKERNANDNIQK